MLRKAPAADGAAAGAADAAAVPTADAAAMPTPDAAAMPTADAAAPPAVDAAMLHTAPAAGAAAGTPNDQPWRLLSMCDKGLHDVFRHCMSKEKEARMKEMEARLKELDRLQYDLRGFMYLSPHQKLEKPLVPDGYNISRPGKNCVDFHCEVKLPLSPWATEHDGPYWSRGTTVLVFNFMTVDGHWKLSNQRCVHNTSRIHFLRMIQITVKHAGSDEWTPVKLWPFDLFKRGSLTAFDTHEPEDATIFGHGDQINMRYIDNAGVSHPVSFDGTQRTNYFPLTICTIG